MHIYSPISTILCDWYSVAISRLCIRIRDFSSLDHDHTPSGSRFNLFTGPAVDRGERGRSHDTTIAHRVIIDALGLESIAFFEERTLTSDLYIHA